MALSLRRRSPLSDQFHFAYLSLLASVCFFSSFAEASIFKLCRDELAQMFAMNGKASPEAIQEAGQKVREQRIALDTVRMILREKNLNFRLEKIAEARRNLTPVLNELFGYEKELVMARARLAGKKGPLTEAEKNLLRQQIEELEVAVKSREEFRTADRKLAMQSYDEYQECPSGMCVAPRTRDDLIRQGKILLIPDPNIAFRSPSLIQAIEKGEQVPEIFVITHQVYDFTTEETLKMLRDDPQFKSVPRVVLGGSSWRVNSTELYDQATVVTPSGQGEFVPGFQLNAQTYHFAGGFCTQCLARSVGEVINGAKRRFQSPKIVLHARQIFWSTTETLEDQIDDAVRNSNSDSNVAAKEISKIVGQIGRYKDKSIRIISDIGANPLVIEAESDIGPRVTIEIRR